MRFKIVRFCHPFPLTHSCSFSLAQSRNQLTRSVSCCGTYRPTDIVVGEHSLRRLRQELLSHELCKELRLELLNETDVAAYVRQRLTGDPLAAELNPIVWRAGTAMHSSSST